MKNIFLFLLIILIKFAYLGKNDYFLEDSPFSESSSSFNGTLTYKGTFNASDYTNITFKNTSSLTPIKSLNISIDIECDNFLHIQIKDKSEKRWEPPYTISAKYKEKVKSCQSSKTFEEFGLSISDPSEPFSFKLQREEETFFDTKDTNFLFSNFFITFGGNLTTDDVFGFGEHFHELKLGEGLFTIWPNDTSGIVYDDGLGGKNLMGAQPIAIHRTKKGNFIGVIFNNINAQDVAIYKYIDDNYNMEHRTIGGIIDYYIYFGGKSVDDTLIKMHEVIGSPTLPPFWALGFHQCRYGYQNTDEVATIMRKFIDLDIPIDTFWTDIDSLDEFRIFSLNRTAFKELPQLVNDIHQNGYHYIPIADLGFAKKDTDPYYKKGKDKAFILSNYTREDMVSYVWPGEAVFPDFFIDEGVDLWKFAMKEFNNTLKYDGLWIDMNEPAMLTFLENGRAEILPEGKKFLSENNIFEYIPYIPGYLPNIRSKTMSENSLSHKYDEDPLYVSYNFKPLLSLLQAKNSYEYFYEQGKRPFILSRSTTIGSGNYAFHWLGDNWSDYKSMQNGLSGIFQFQIYGIPMTGDDICGFIGNSNDLLCSRWISLGAFFPFSRNHNGIDYIPQDPTAFGLNSLTFKSSYKALRLRYSLLRYYYSQLFLISLGKSGSFFKPAFFEFPNDPLSYKYTDKCAMIGNALYLIPILKEDKEKMEAYFPNADWNIFENGVILKNYTKDKEEGSEMNITATYNDIHLYMRGGYIIPKQETNYPYVKNTKVLRGKPTEIIINPDTTIVSYARGEVIFDDDGVDTIEKGNYIHVEMNFYYDTLSLIVQNRMNSTYLYKDIYISYIVIFRAGYLENIKNREVIVRDIWGNVFYGSYEVNEGNVVKINIKRLKLTFLTLASVRLSEKKFLAFTTK